MSRPLLEFGGGSGEILPDLLHLRSVSEAEALISRAEGRDQLRHICMSLQAPEPLGRFEDAGGEATGALGLPGVLHRVSPAARDDPQSVRLGHRGAVSGDRGAHAGDRHLASPRAAGGVRDRVARGPPRSGAVRHAVLHRRADRRGAGAAVRRSGGIGAAAAGEGREATHHSGPRGSQRLAVNGHSKFPTCGHRKFPTPG